MVVVTIVHPPHFFLYVSSMSILRFLSVLPIWHANILPKLVLDYHGFFYVMPYYEVYAP